MDLKVDREEIRRIRVERDVFKAFIAGLAEGDCGYGDNCPVFGSRHGRCVHCLAREVLEEGTRHD